MENNLNIGDLVKVIPPSYHALSKGFFLYPECWSESNSQTDKIVMLGGEYKILRKSERPESDFLVILDKSENYSGYVHPSFLIKNTEVDKCKFKVGSLVKFTPTCDKNDKKTLHLLFDKVFPFDNPNQFLKVSHIVNGYYIFLEKPNGEEYQWPFRWVDFTDV